MQSDPLAYFITWTVYGSHLQGDGPNWRKWKRGFQQPKPLLAQWRREQLKHPIFELDTAMRTFVADEVKRLSGFRQWHLWRENTRTNHVHVVVTASMPAGNKVRDQLKANCTRVLREQDKRFIDRPVWSVGGDWQCINHEDDLETLICYVSEAQDLKHIGEP